MKIPSWIEGLKSDSTTEIPKGYYSAQQLAKMTNRTVNRCREMLAEEVKSGKLKRVKVKIGRVVEYYYGE